MSDAREALASMLWARSVAVVGASPRVGSLGNRVMRELIEGGFAGPVTPVTPNHRALLGVDSVPSLADLESPADVAVLAVADSRLEEQMELALATGHRAAVIFSPCQGTAKDGSPLRLRLGELARRGGMAVCGPNGMGLVNVVHRLRLTGFYMPPRLLPGGITFLSHSGSLFAAMLHNHRHLSFNLVVSTGQEVATTMDAYLDQALDLDSTRVVGLFLETVRRVEGMRAALEKAAGRGIPVVALKVGRTERARTAAATHSGALAGEDPVYSAFFESFGVHRVRSLGELADTLELFASPRRARPGALGAVLDSGGERTLLLDAAEEAGVPLAAVSEDTRRRLAEVLEEGLEPDNPVDAWGTGRHSDDIFAAAIGALADDPAVGAVAFAVDLTPEEDPAEGYVPLLLRQVDGLPVPVVVLSHAPFGTDPEQAARLRRAGIPVLEGTVSGLRALGHLLAHAVRPAGERPSAVPGPGKRVRDRWRRRLETAEPWTEAEGLELLADYGITTASWVAAHDRESVVEAARRIGFPVVLKTAGGAEHKTSVGGVIRRLGDEAAVAAAYGDLLRRLGPAVLVQREVAPGVELALGVVVDDQFGPLVMVGAGGTLVELLADRLLALPPVDAAVARRLLARLRCSPLLDGHRGAPPADREAAAKAVAALARLAQDLGHLLAGLDVNPLIVTPSGAVAVDTLVVPRVAARPSAPGEVGQDLL